MKLATLAVPHPVVFVLDPGNKQAVLPDLVRGQVTASTSTCVLVGTQAEVDGDVTFRLGAVRAADVDARLTQVFAGSVETPGRKLAIVTSHNERVLEADVPGSVTRVLVSVDDTVWPATVQVLWE
jgi:hypothetical protein